VVNRKRTSTLLTSIVPSAASCNEHEHRGMMILEERVNGEPMNETICGVDLLKHHQLGRRWTKGCAQFACIPHAINHMYSFPFAIGDRVQAQDGGTIFVGTVQRRVCVQSIEGMSTPLVQIERLGGGYLTWVTPALVQKVVEHEHDTT